MNDQSGKGQTRIQKQNSRKIREAALDVFSAEGFRGATIDRIAAAAGMSKPNLLYYYATKEEIYRAVLDATLDNWLEPLRAIDPDGDAVSELRNYIRRKLEMARDFPRESRLYANEIIRGAPIITEELEDLRTLVNEKSEIIRGWIARGQMAEIDPRHLFFAIWAMTQHYADFDAQVRTVLDDSGDGRFNDAARAVETLVFSGLRPRP
ncbi:TetR family transcriptional regulator C-terminal domain-containing protein [Oceanomicrobium pacificus]|uniref:TetR family transcriptional regulator n=1 Tax=Oceanomicrobium pacificus TaxID=2692916 RepID=A0A6B0TX45_9RHOB|nr:TetR family transcriptional regulator C-terminal domain-containing protein [Oceanomicrobium pacificus]MXU65593.1 TetR family transcriptional regulator [Oceanomicrobium pacificus]